MYCIDFTDKDISQLRHERFYHPHPRIQQRMEALLLKSEGLPHKTICKIVGIGENTLRRYLKRYIEGGIDNLKKIPFYKPKSELHNYRDSIEDYFRNHPPASLKEAASRIEELTGIRRSISQVHSFLKSIGMRLYKTGTIPAKANLEAQETFKKKNWSLDLQRHKLEKGLFCL